MDSLGRGNKFAGRLGEVGDRKRTITFGREGQKESIKGEQTRIGGHLEDDLQTYSSRSFLEPMICPQWGFLAMEDLEPEQAIFWNLVRLPTVGLEHLTNPLTYNLSYLQDMPGKWRYRTCGSDQPITGVIWGPCWETESMPSNAKMMRNQRLYISAT